MNLHFKTPAVLFGHKQNANPHHLAVYSRDVNSDRQNALNDASLPAGKTNSRQDWVRCALGLALYAVGLFLFAYGQLVQPSLLLMLAGSAVLILGCHTFMPAESKIVREDNEDF